MVEQNKVIQPDNNMPKKKLLMPILLIALILVIIILGIFILLKIINTPEEVSIEEAPYDYTQEILKDDETYICMALASKEVTECDTSPAKENCYNSYYLEYYLFNDLISEVNDCNQITDSRQIICNALATKNANLCENIKSGVGEESAEELKIICKALTKRDISECASIEDEGLKTFCESKMKISDIIKNKNLDDCASAADYHDFLKCKSIITKNANVCIEQRASDEAEISYQDCEELNILPNYKKSFCELYRQI